MLEAIREAIATAMSADEKVMVLGQDVGNLGGIFRATDGLLAKFGDKRVIETDRRDSVLGLRPTSFSSDCATGGPHAVPLPGPFRSEPGNPCAVRRRRSDSRAAFRCD
jgi:hypothetical protein